jgi:predicted nucleic acid-binding protein
MRWLVDTSAWARRGIPEVRDQLKALLAEDDEHELALSGPVLLELLTGPQGAAVAAEQAQLREVVPVIATDDETFRLAAEMMENLALAGPEHHRRPVADLLTAALAHQHGWGLVHIDRDFELIAAHGGVPFLQRRLQLPGSGDASHPAETQRTLKRELNQALHRLPVATAEALLSRAVAEARQAAAT